MIVLEAADYAVRRTTGMFHNPRQTAREVVGGAGHVAGLGLETALRIVGGPGAEIVYFPFEPLEDAVGNHPGAGEAEMMRRTASTRR